MHWQLLAAVLLLSWINNTPSQIDAAKLRNLDDIQYWQPISDPQSIDSRQYEYPSYVERDLTIPRGGYNRRRHFPARFKAATTERPFVRVWNSFVRSVQPNFGFRNLTNPLANFFTNGNANIIETVPLQAQVITDDQDEADQEMPVTPASTTKNPNKRKRKRRKQQKRRPSYDSLEQDDPYDYYGSSLPIVLPQQQPMFYYSPGANGYYDTRRLHAFNDYANPGNFYDQFFENSRTSEEEEQQPEENVRNLSTKKLTILRPLEFTFKVFNENDPTVGEPEDHTVVENPTNQAIESDATPNEQIDASSPTTDDSLSEGMRNAIGTYMRDDPQIRERQRQSEKPSEATTAVKVSPRFRNGFVLAERLFK